MRPFEASAPVADVPEKLSARSTSSVFTSPFLIAAAQRFSRERIVAAVAQLLSDKSKVGREARGPALGRAGSRRMNGVPRSSARTAGGRNTLRLEGAAEGADVARCAAGVAAGRWGCGGAAGAFDEGCACGVSAGAGVAVAVGAGARVSSGGGEPRRIGAAASCADNFAGVSRLTAAAKTNGARCFILRDRPGGRANRSARLLVFNTFRDTQFRTKNGARTGLNEY